MYICTYIVKLCTIMNAYKIGLIEIILMYALQ